MNHQNIMEEELDKIATDVTDVINEHIDNSISWAIDGTSVDNLNNNEFVEAITKIKQLVIKKLKDYE